MRNKQLIRQWKILKFIADDSININNLNDRKILIKIFDINMKTLLRDLDGLAQVEFIECIKKARGGRVKEGNQVKADKVKIKLFTKQIEIKTKQIEIKSKSNWLNNYGIEKCNHCSYLFKKKENGQIDLKDLVKHKKLHSLNDSDLGV